jgi:protein-S-isoprenylcysteine O-methyltransferase Ste14
MKTDLKVKRHKDRDDLTGEHVWGDAGQVILLLIFLVVWILDSFIFQFSTVLSHYVPLYVRMPASLVIWYCAGYLARSGLRIIFGETREQPIVIRKGVFNRVRHPIYLGSLLFLFGFSVLTLSVFSLILWLGIFVFYHFISRYEEKLLLNKFGAEYEKYMSEVPMWIPRLRIGV